MTLPEQSDGPGVRSVRHPRGRRPAHTEGEKVLLDHEAVERTLAGEERLGVDELLVVSQRRGGHRVM